MIAALAQDNVIRVYETGVVGSYFYLVMEFLEGGDLRSRIADGMGWRDALSVARSIADALEHAHTHGVLHRDIRPSNVLFDSDGRPVLSNFAISRIIERDGEATRPMGSAGLPLYSAPEQLLGRGATTRSILIRWAF
ncbi:MAG: protein kinase [Gammaproteobacteria bacterium]|nr:protein kinase [Gammaproteobacteria bacterium]